MTSSDFQWEYFFNEAGVDTSDAKIYASIFIKNKVTQSILHLLNDDYLKSMGITAIGDVIRILSFIGNFKLKSENTSLLHIKDEKLNSSSNTNLQGTMWKTKEERKCRPTSNDIRRQICKMHDHGYTQSHISKLLDVKRTTARDIIKKYETTGVMEADRRGGCIFKRLGPEYEDAIKNLIKENCSLSLRNISKKIQQQFSISVCPSTINKYLKGFSYMMERMTRVRERRNDPQTISSRYDYAEKYFSFRSNYSEKEIIFLDEIRLSVCMKDDNETDNIERSEIENIRQIRSKNYCVCCAMNVEGILYYCVYRKSVNSESFLKYLDLLLAELKKKEIFKGLIIMQNGTLYNNEGVKNTVSDSGYDYSFLPPWSPFLNPIENMFSKWKEIVMRSVPDNELDLFMSMCNAKSEINASDTKGYYTRMTSYLSKCLSKECIDS